VSWAKRLSDEVAAPFGVAGVGEVEQIDEGLGIVTVGDEAEELAPSNVVRTHQTQRAVANVLELAAHRLAGLHWEVGMATLQSLHAGLLIEADDVLTARRLVVDVQHIVALLAEVLVVRRQIHLLSVGLQRGLFENSAHGAVADGEALAAHVLAQQRCRPVRYRYADVLRRLRRFCLDACGVGFRERETGRPDRGASCSTLFTSSSSRKRFFFHLKTVRT
jgi:hypothetical protein